MEANEYLKHYNNVVAGRDDANFIKLKSVAVNFDPEWDTKKLMDIHNRALRDIQPEKGKIDQNLLQLKAILAGRILYGDGNVGNGDGRERCIWMVDERLEGWGFLGGRVHRVRTAGCNLSCVFCRHWNISQRTQVGEAMKPIQIAFRIAQRHHEGGLATVWGHSDPVAYLPQILDALSHLNVNIPQVWKTNLYHNADLIDVLRGVPDVLYSDYTFGNDRCAERMAGVENYTGVVRNAIKALAVDSERYDFVINHMPLPNHMECCTKEVLSWVSEKIPDVKIVLDNGYRPDYRAWLHKDISRLLSDRERKQVTDIYRRLYSTPPQVSGV